MERGKGAQRTHRGRAGLVAASTALIRAAHRCHCAPDLSMIPRRLLPTTRAVAMRSIMSQRLMHTVGGGTLRAAATATPPPQPSRPLMPGTPPTRSSSVQLVDVPAAATGLHVNAGVLSHLRVMARYHRWASARLLSDHVAGLSDAEYFGAAGQCLFFRSVHGTLAHMALADRLWLARLTTGGTTGAEHLWADHATPHDTERFMPHRQQVAQAIEQGSQVKQQHNQQSQRQGA